MGELYFYYNDLYPNNLGNNTRTQTIPDADDKKALGENVKSGSNKKVTPNKKKNIFMALGVILVLAVVMGISK